MFPFVFVDRFVPGIDADMVSADNEAAGRLATEYLLSRGHRTVAYLYSPHRMNTAQQERLQGYRAAMSAAGHDPIPWEADGRGADRSQEAKEAMCSLLDDPSTHRVTGIIAATDSTALGALRAFGMSDCEVPGQFSLVGIGGSPLMDYLRPPITTVTLPMRALGIEAASLLLARIEGDVTAFRHRRLDVELVERGSCADARS